MSAQGLQRQLLASLSLGLAPLALFQGWRLRRNAVRLPEVSGQREGFISGAEPALSLLAVGESPLAGVGLKDARSTVACRLAERLRDASGQAVAWRILARGGFTAKDVSNRLLPDLGSGTVDLMLIGLGVNDSLRLRSARRWQRDLESLIRALRARTGPAPVLLAGVPDMGHFPALPLALKLMLGSRSRLLDHAAGRLSERLLDSTHVPMQLDARSTDLFCTDGFHPNARGHAMWAEQLTPAALALLGLSAGRGRH